MRRFRFTIGGMLALVVFLAVSIAALREATDLWDSGVFTAALGVLLAAVLLAVHRTGRQRAFWLGFALFGWAYLAASLVPPAEARLLTTKGLAYPDSKVPGRTFAYSVNIRWPNPGKGNTVQALAFTPDGSDLATNQQGVVRFWNATTGVLLAGPDGTTASFVRIGHSILALLLGFAGGRLSRWLSGRAAAPSVPAPGVDVD
jgi:hypothetical protein